MSRNVEIKAYVSDMVLLHLRVKKISTEDPIEIYQHDTFFCCEQGRLKLRKLADDRGELIFYQRPNKLGPQASFYLKSDTTDPDTLRQSLELAYGLCGQVTKRRTLYRVGRTRVHLDKVDGLGEFMELEVVLTETDSIEGGETEAVELMRQLEIEPTQLVEGAYLDLISK